MAQSIVTVAAEQWLADKLNSNAPARPDRMIFAYIPDQDPNTPIDRSEGLPSPEHIQHTADITQYGLLNENAVIYSVVLDSTIGDWSYNWIGLLDSQNDTVVMIVHTHTQDKLKTHNGVQGNTLTRNLVMQFSGAANAAQVTVTAETWQIDYSARLMGIDERLRIENMDTYGPGAFFGDGFLVSQAAGVYQVAGGVGYVHGLRCEQAENTPIATGTLPTKVWVDASLQGTVTSRWEVTTQLTCSPELSHYTKDSFNHFVFAIAAIAADGTVTDLRPKGPTQQQDDKLALHEKSRNHPDGTLNAKGFVQLSDALDSHSRELASTPNAVRIAMDNANARLAKERNGADIPNVELFINNLGLRETVNKAADSLQKAQNGADIPDKSVFVRNIGAARALSGSIHIGGNSNVWTTTQFITWLEGQGAFNHPYWMCKGSWSYANNNVITDTGCGNICLAGAVVEVMGIRSAMTIRITTPSRASGGGMPDAQFIYINHGDQYAPGWRRDFNRAGDTMTGPLKVAGEIQSTNADSFRIAYGRYGTYWRNDGANLYLMLTNADNRYGGFNTLRPFMLNVATGELTLGKTKLNDYTYFDARYTLLNHAYSKAESNARYVSDIRMGANSYVDWGTGGGTVPAGCVLTGGNFDDARSRAFYAPVQKCVNGTWYNVVRV